LSVDVDVASQVEPRFAVGIPTVGVFADPTLLCSLACSAEAAGWDGVFIWEHLLYRDEWDVIDSWVALSAIAAQTTRVKLGLLVAALPRHHPWEVAKCAVSLDRLSSGRFILGVGIGSMAEEYTAFAQAVDVHSRGRRLDEALTVIERLWTGKPVIFDGEHFTVTAPAMLPRPVQSPRIPIWVAGRWPNKPPFARAARYDGVVPTHLGYGKGETIAPSELEEVVSYIKGQRDKDKALQVALEGQTPSEPFAAGRIVSGYVEAGLTWWIEALGWWRGDVATAMARVNAGPPRLTA
jgi:alkanesulfonate monooxygenase SsuD/methylene tetrahydromethanopterin reductase-like flavin-dependent oxidoreductase (luciferase family)